MFELLNSVESRDLEILLILYEDIKWWPVQELADKIGFSSDTVYKSIANINSTALNENRPYYINVKQNWGVQLEIDDTITIDHISSLYIYHSLGYKMLTKLFEATDITMQKLADDLYFSKSTIYRKLLDIKHVIELNHLSLNMNTLEITGEEMIIRQLMIKTYWCAIYHTNWPFTVVSESVISHRIAVLSKVTSAAINEDEQLLLSILLTVNFIRHQKKKYIITFPHKELIDSCKQQSVAQLAPLVSAKIPKEYLENEMCYLASFGFINRYCARDPLKVAEINAFHHDSRTLTYQMYEKLLQLFNDYSDNNINLKIPTLQYQLTNFFISSIMYRDVQIQSKTLEHNVETLKTQSPFFIAFLTNIITKFNEIPEFKPYSVKVNEAIMELYFIFIVQIELREIEKPLKIRLSCSENPDFENGLKKLLKKQIHTNLDIYTSLNSQPDEKDNAYDLVIYDVSNTEKQLVHAKEQYSWHVPPTTRDWDNINQILDRLNKRSELSINEETK